MGVLMDVCLRAGSVVAWLPMCRVQEKFYIIDSIEKSLWPNHLNHIKLFKRSVEVNTVGSADNTFQLNMKEKYLCVHLKNSTDYKLQ